MTEFPFISGRVNNQAAALPVFTEYAWDFENNCFLRDADGEMILLSGNEALKVWIYKALKTERFAYLAYTPRYGMELHHFIGKVMGINERKSELRRLIIECLMVNPYIKSVDSIDFVDSEHSRGMEIKISLTTIYSELTL